LVGNLTNENVGKDLFSSINSTNKVQTNASFGPNFRMESIETLTSKIQPQMQDKDSVGKNPLVRSIFKIKEAIIELNFFLDPWKDFALRKISQRSQNSSIGQLHLERIIQRLFPEKCQNKLIGIIRIVHFRISPISPIQQKLPKCHNDAHLKP
jgi:hypothetical protein